MIRSINHYIYVTPPLMTHTYPCRASELESQLSATTAYGFQFILLDLQQRMTEATIDTVSGLIGGYTCNSRLHYSIHVIDLDVAG